MHPHLARLEFENRESVRFILRQLLPGIRGQTKSFVEPRKILLRRHERSLEIPDLNDLELVHQGLRARRERACAGRWRGWSKTNLHIRKEVGILLQIDKLHVLFSRRSFHRQRQDHGQFLFRVERHAVHQQLPPICVRPRKNIRSAYRYDRLRKATHKILSVKALSLETRPDYQKAQSCKSKVLQYFCALSSQPRILQAVRATAGPEGASHGSPRKGQVIEAP